MGLALILTADIALAGGGSMTSGRPSAVLTPEQCQQVWDGAQIDGDKLSAANATRIIANFSQADADGDGSLTKQEFDTACTKGLVKFTDR
jgi:hypothetical protein